MKEKFDKHMQHIEKQKIDEVQKQKLVSIKLVENVEKQLEMFSQTIEEVLQFCGTHETTNEITNQNTNETMNEPSNETTNGPTNKAQPGDKDNDSDGSVQKDMLSGDITTSTPFPVSPVSPKRKVPVQCFYCNLSLSTEASYKRHQKSKNHLNKVFNYVESLEKTNVGVHEE